MGKLPSFARNMPDDRDRFRAMTPEQRLALFIQLCDVTDSVVNARPDPSRLRQPHPRSTEAEALWQRLMLAADRG